MDTLSAGELTEALTEEIGAIVDETVDLHFKRRWIDRREKHLGKKLTEVIGKIEKAFGSDTTPEVGLLGETHHEAQSPQDQRNNDESRDNNDFD